MVPMVPIVPMVPMVPIVPVLPVVHWQTLLVVSQLTPAAEQAESEEQPPAGWQAKVSNVSQLPLWHWLLSEQGEQRPPEAVVPVVPVVPLTQMHEVGSQVSPRLVQLAPPQLVSLQLAEVVLVVPTVPVVALVPLVPTVPVVLVLVVWFTQLWLEVSQVLPGAQQPNCGVPHWLAPKQPNRHAGGFCVESQ
jgi:signal-induced proliferation-associated 1 like protein 3